jgi:hypothetical protein
LCSGDLDSISLATGLPNLPGYVALHSNAWRSGDRDFKNAVWLSIWDDGGTPSYSLTLMLPDADYQVFATIAATHLGQNITWVISFRTSDMGATHEEFLAGKKLLIKDLDDIEFSFVSRPQRTQTAAAQ